MSTNSEDSSSSKKGKITDEEEEDLLNLRQVFTGKYGVDGATHFRDNILSIISGFENYQDPGEVIVQKSIPQTEEDNLKLRPSKRIKLGTTKVSALIEEGLISGEKKGQIDKPMDNLPLESKEKIKVQGSESDRSHQKFSFQRNDPDSSIPYWIPNIIWGTKKPPKVLNTCGLDSMLFGWFCSVKNGWSTCILNKETGSIYDLMNKGSFDEARHLIFNRGEGSFDSPERYLAYVKCAQADAWGTLTRFFFLLNPHYMGSNKSVKCSDCDKSFESLDYAIEFAVEEFPDNFQELHETVSKRLHESNNSQSCKGNTKYIIAQKKVEDLEAEDSKEKDFDTSLAIKLSQESIMMSQVTTDSTCEGTITSTKEPCIFGRFFLLKQIHVCGDRISDKKSELLFTDINNIELVEGKVFGEVRFVCFCNGSHFKVAFATNDKNG